MQSTSPAAVPQGDSLADMRRERADGVGHRGLKKVPASPDLEDFYSYRKLFSVGMKGPECRLLYTQVVLTVVSVLCHGSAVVQG